MSLTAEQIRRFAAEGFTAEQIAVIAEVWDAGKAEKRERDRVRQAEYRATKSMSHDVTVTSCDNTRQDVTDVTTPSQGSVLPHTPSLTPNSPSKEKENPLKGDFLKRKVPNLSRLALNDLPPPWAEWSHAAMGWDAETTSDQWVAFRDYWQAKQGKTACKSDWKATWRNWCRSAVVRPKKQQTPFKTFDELKEEKWAEAMRQKGYTA